MMLPEWIKQLAADCTEQERQSLKINNRGSDVTEIERLEKLLEMAEQLEGSSAEWFADQIQRELDRAHSDAVGIRQYINEHYDGNQKRFSEAINVRPTQITRWINEEFIVYRGALYSKRRDLPNP